MHVHCTHTRAQACPVPAQHTLRLAPAVAGLALPPAAFPWPPSPSAAGPSLVAIMSSSPASPAAAWVGCGGLWVCNVFACVRVCASVRPCMCVKTT